MCVRLHACLPSRARLLISRKTVKIVPVVATVGAKRRQRVRKRRPPRTKRTSRRNEKLLLRQTVTTTAVVPHKSRIRRAAQQKKRTAGTTMMVMATKDTRAAAAAYRLRAGAYDVVSEPFFFIYWHAIFLSSQRQRRQHKNHNTDSSCNTSTSTRSRLGVRHSLESGLLQWTSVGSVVGSGVRSNPVQQKLAGHWHYFVLHNRLMTQHTSTAPHTLSLIHI